MDVEELFEDLKSQDAEDRRYAIEDLLDEDDERIPAEIAELLADKEDSVREKAIDALMEIADKNAVAAAIPFLSTEDVPARNAAIEILEKIGGGAPELLIDLLKGDNDDVKIFTLTIISKLGYIDEDLSAEVATLLDSDVENVVSEACLAVTACGLDDYLPKIKEIFANSETDSLKIHIILAITAFDEDIAKSAFDDLEKMDISDDVKMHINIARNMAKENENV